ncbi:MAG: hypothetical protein K5673_05310 [Lachnospiraceae bacterium]|nr:hypothetical protein [Lachnospiraceae bacterium]
MIRFNNYSNIFGNTGSIYNSLAQLNSVRRGSYGKLLKAYYAKDNTASVSKKTAGKTAAKSTRYDYPLYSANAGLDEIRTQTDKLAKSAAKLTDSSRNGLFADRADYDPEVAYKAVNEFISDYNSTLDSVNKTTNTTVTNAANNMTRMADIMSNSLSRVGVTVGRNGRLSIDEEVFKNTDMDKVRSVLGSGGSFARSVGSYSARLGSAAKQQSLQAANNTGIYGRYGTYNTNSYGTGNYSWWY